MFESCLRLLAWPLLLLQGAPNLPPSLHLEKFPVRLQSTDYTCGPSALSATFAYYGVTKTEMEISTGCDTNAEVGTSIRRLAEYASREGLPCEVRTELSVWDLATSLKRGAPVLVLIQEAGEEIKPPVDYANLWTDGHFVVVTGMDSEKIYFMDPYAKTGRSHLRHNDFLDRWHDLSFTGEKFVHAGILFR